MMVAADRIAQLGLMAKNIMDISLAAHARIASGGIAIMIPPLTAIVVMIQKFVYAIMAPMKISVV